MNKKENVSMPSTGFYSFLQRMENIWRTEQKRVNALNGLLLISTDGEHDEYENRRRSVNALNGLLLISTLKTSETSVAANQGVNALNGLLLISTVASRKP